MTAGSLSPAGAVRIGTCDGCVAVDAVLLPAGKARIVAAVIVGPCDGIRLSIPCDGILITMSEADDDVATWPCASSVPETSVSAEGGTVAALPCQTGDATGIPACAWLDSGRDVGFVAMVDETSAIDSDFDVRSRYQFAKISLGLEQSHSSTRN